MLNLARNKNKVIPDRTKDCDSNSNRDVEKTGIPFISSSVSVTREFCIVIPA